MCMLMGTLGVQYIQSSTRAGSGTTSVTAVADNQETQIVTSPGELERAVAKHAENSHYGSQLTAETKSEVIEENPEVVCLTYFFVYMFTPEYPPSNEIMSISQLNMHYYVLQPLFFLTLIHHTFP